ncbi:phage head-tail connector protein [Clostridium ihumii]|uniref:phage head-tail connector protein n=1 Tax=Clostridium ihumii TaxID=1470356 RepID=UPI00058DCF58|nr:hypothetical protein [Clostridium ihumii]
MNNELLQDIKDYLNISWQDEKIDKNIAGMIKRGMAYLKDVAGVKELDFEEENNSRALLFDYVRYANSQALEMFSINFQSELLSLHLEYQAKALQEKKNENKSS